MAMCDEFPEFYFPDDSDEFPWDKPDWGDSNLERTQILKEVNPFIFNNYREALRYARDNPGEVITRNPNGHGFIVKSSLTKKRTAKPLLTKKQVKQEDNIRNGRPKNANIAWRDTDLSELIKFHKQQMTFLEISMRLERTQNAIVAKLINLGLVPEGEYQKLFDK